MNAISSAGPCHVVIHGIGYDVLVWTVDADGDPIPWINYDGRPKSFYDIPFADNPILYTGTAAEHAAGKR